MRRKIKVDFLSLGLGIAVAVVAVVLFEAYQGNTKALDPVELSQATLLVEGMGCEGCPSRISRGIRRLEGVQAINIDKSKGTVFVEYVRGVTSVKEIIGRVQSLGFQASLPPGVGKIEVLDFNLKFN